MKAILAAFVLLSSGLVQANISQQQYTSADLAAIHQEALSEQIFRAEEKQEACTVGCWGKFDPNNNTVCNVQSLQMCVKLTFCEWTCK